MKLSQLEPQFVTSPSPGRLQDVDTLAEAQGVMLLCPRCFERNGGPVGTHSLLIWFRDRGVPPDATPGPGRWAASGSGYDDLTLSPSINLETPDGHGCQWHGFVTNGETR